jgi:hypothetical protein
MKTEHLKVIEIATRVIDAKGGGLDYEMLWNDLLQMNLLQGMTPEHALASQIRELGTKDHFIEVMKKREKERLAMDNQ